MADRNFIAFWSYLSGVFPLVGMALLEMGLSGKGKNALEKMKLHFILLTIFLIVAHVAMIFGMVDPGIVAKASGGQMNM